MIAPASEICDEGAPPEVTLYQTDSGIGSWNGGRLGEIGAQALQERAGQHYLPVRHKALFAVDGQEVAPGLAGLVTITQRAEQSSSAHQAAVALII